MLFPTENAGSGNKRILVAQAKSPGKFLISSHLASRGYEVQCAETFKDANRTLPQGASPSITVSDSSMCILIVEDDGLSLELMKIILTKNGYKVEMASTGIEAIEACRRKAFDLIFMDLQMPGMDGFTTAARIREVETEGRRVPIIALTASNISRQAHENLSTEFARILAKPFQIQTILETIQEFTGGQNSSKENNITHETARVIDVRAALPHFGLDTEQYREILSEFQASLPSRIKEMDMDFQNGDIKNLARRAHNLKGVAANVGAMRLSHLSARLDEVDDSAEDQYIRETLDDIRASIQELQETAQETIDTFIPEAAQTMRDK